MTAYLAAMLAVAWVLPERLWQPLCRAMATANGRLRPRRAKQLCDLLCWLLGTGAGESRRLVIETRANIHMRHFHYLRTLRPGGWSPGIRLEGRERIDAALAAGRGVILWVSPLLFSDLVTKMALARDGLRVSHLSMYVHGFSRTRFGFRVLNRLAVRGEERFLAERLVITPQRPLDAIRELTKRVRDGKVVSVSAVVSRGQRSLTLPFLHGKIRLAVGAAQLARRTGATLLPVFTVRLEDGSFLTTVDEPIDLAPDRDRDEAAEIAVERYVQKLERYVKRWPSQYPAFAPGYGSEHTAR
jgi:lauroyl/myristoyl acyltransferase